MNKDFSTEYLMTKFSNGKSVVGMSESTLKQYRIAIQKLEEYTKKPFAECEPEDIVSFIREYGKTVSDVTLRGKFQLLSSVYNWLFLHKYINYNPISYVDSPRATVIYKDSISSLDIEKIKKSCEILPEKESLRDMALIHFFICTGCRVSEVANIKIRDVNFDKKTCIVLGKGRKERPVVLTDKCIYRLKLYLNERKDKKYNDPLFASIRGQEKPLTKDGILRIVHKLSKNSGLEMMGCHSFRRYCSTELRKKNVPVQMIATYLGHANLNQIQRYSRFTTEESENLIRAAL